MKPQSGLPRLTENQQVKLAGNMDQNIINLEDGWNVEIKRKALDPLEVFLIQLD